MRNPTVSSASAAARPRPPAHRSQKTRLGGPPVNPIPPRLTPTPAAPAKASVHARRRLRRRGEECDSRNEIDRVVLPPEQVVGGVQQSVNRRGERGFEPRHRGENRGRRDEERDGEEGRSRRSFREEPTRPAQRRRKAMTLCKITSYMNFLPIRPRERAPMRSSHDSRSRRSPLSVRFRARSLTLARNRSPVTRRGGVRGTSRVPRSTAVERR
jgi:hypothetical protein